MVICLEFTENPKDIRGNEFQYTILKSGTDTLKLGYRVTGERLNHCGTFTYYLNNQGELLEPMMSVVQFIQQAI